MTTEQITELIRNAPSVLVLDSIYEEHKEFLQRHRDVQALMVKRLQELSESITSGAEGWEG